MGTSPHCPHDITRFQNGDFSVFFSGIWHYLQRSCRFKIIRVFVAHRLSKFLTCVELGGASIFHTRLRLNFSALNYHLFQKNCCLSPACALCDVSIKDVKHYFLYCPSFAALRENLFTYCASDKKKIDWLLNGISTADFQINVRLFQLAQSFISLSNRFC